MASEKKGSSEAAAQAPKHGNGFDPDEVKAFVDRVENIQLEIDSEKGEYMRRIQVLRDDIKDILTEAKDAGLPKKELKAVIKTRAMRRKLEALRDDLDPPEQDNYDMIRHALGELADLPLGQSALAAA